MIAKTPRDVLGHVAALERPISDRHKRIAALEKRVKYLSERHRHTDSLKQLGLTIDAIRSELKHLGDDDPLDPTILMDDVVHTLKVNHIPLRRFGLN